MYQICISGAARGPSVEAGKALAYQSGFEIARNGHVTLTGATSGIPDYGAHGAKAGGGMSIGISPAATKAEHVLKYRLPFGCYDTVLYTGLHYIGRDVLLVASSDAVLSIGGRMGTLHEFTIAMEMGKPIAVINGAGGISEKLGEILEAAGKTNSNGKVIFGTDPAKVVKQLIKKIEENYKNHQDIYKIGPICEVEAELDKNGNN